MHDSLHISAYTPSNTAPEILEKIFVQRHKLLEKTVAWCEESICSDKKNHLLFIGPRGSGKTHFITMVVNRLRNKLTLQDKMIIIWLGEDDVITSLVDLALAIIEQLVKIDPARFNKDCLAKARGQKPETVADIILHSISEQIGKRTILLVKENMSDVFNGLKDIGQKKLRAYLQEKNNIALLSSSQQLFSGVSSRDEAFFGFFDIHHLKVLEAEDAKQLISNIAALNNDQALVDFLATAQGCYRVRALHHLAGGNHRLYVELAAFLSTASLDNFVSALTKLADNLTPYFQERVRSLPPQQGRIVQKLCEIQGATPVKSIAEATFIDERSAAKQLGELAKKGYVISHKRGKQSYYEMAEPLMRLALEVKNNQGKPLKMVASLLRTWFSDAELQKNAGKLHGLSSAYSVAALSIDKSLLVAINHQIGAQIDLAIAANDPEKVIAASSEIINSPETDGIPLLQKVTAFIIRGETYYYLGETKLARQDCTAIINMNAVSVELKTDALLKRATTYSQKDESEFKLQDLNAIIEMLDAPNEQKALALLNRSYAYEKKGAAEQALQDLITAIELPKIAEEILTLALFYKPVLYFKLLQIDNAQLALQAAFEKGEKQSQFYPSNTPDLLLAINQLGSSFWQKQITWLLALYAEYGALDNLGAALVHSITFFIEDESLASAFKKWQQLWQEQAEQYPEMQLPLQVLQAAMLAVEQKNDTPLMRLPKEVRELVLPLLAKVLA
ncbi:MAG: hypothetical protein NTV00_02290 [Methylococcales bacterium]|nr:hypothetical protein [Methylococcales bacterium]